MKFNLYQLAAAFGMLVMLSAFTKPSTNLNSAANLGEPTTASDSKQKKLVLLITSTTGQPVEFSAFIRHGEENYRLEKETTPYRLVVEDKNFSGVFHKLTEGGEWEVKAEKFVGENRLTDVKGAYGVTVVESSEHTISSWGM